MLEKYNKGEQLKADDVNTLLEYAGPKYPEDWRDQYADFFTEQIFNIACPPCAIVPAYPRDFGHDLNLNSELYLIAEPNAYNMACTRKAAYGFQPCWVLLDEPDTWDMRKPYGPKPGFWGLHKGWGNWRTFGPIRTLPTGEKVVLACQPVNKSVRAGCFKLDFKNQKLNTTWKTLQSACTTQLNNKIDFLNLSGTYQFYFDFTLASPEYPPSESKQTVQYRLTDYDPTVAGTYFARYEYQNEWATVTKAIGIESLPAIEPLIWNTPRFLISLIWDFAAYHQPFFNMNVYDNISPAIDDDEIRFQGTLSILKIGQIWNANAGIDPTG